MRLEVDLKQVLSQYIAGPVSSLRRAYRATRTGQSKDDRAVETAVDRA